MLKAATESLKGVAGGDGNEPQKKRGPYGPRKPRDPNAPPPKPKQPKARRDLITVVPRPILRKGEEEVDEQELEKGGGGGGGGGDTGDHPPWLNVLFFPIERKKEQLRDKTDPFSRL